MIKGRTLGGARSFPTNFLPESALSGEQPRDGRRGKILKAAALEALQEQKKKEQARIHEIFGDTSDLFEEQAEPEVQEPEFQPVAFQSQENHEQGPRNVVMIPTRDAPVQEEDDEFLDNADFEVQEPQHRMMPSVDVEALIAEAEQKGREKAQKIIEHAQAEAKKLIDQAKIYGETAKQEAHREGFELGKEDGYKAGLEEFGAYMNEAKNLFTQIAREREQVLGIVEPQLAELAMDIARKIIGEELQVNPDVVINVTGQALTKVKAQEEVIIKVNPEELDYVKENRDVFVKLVEGLKNLEIVSDPRVDKGGCMIETSLGSADGRIKTQLAAIELAFKNLTTGE